MFKYNENVMIRLKQLFNSGVTRIKIVWLKYWALQRRFAFDHTTVSFRRALTLFLSALLAVYFLIGLPVFGYLVYAKKDEGTALSIAATIYPFPVAIVGNDIILLKPYSDRLSYLRFFAKQTQQPLPNEADLRNQVVTKLIDESIIRQWSKKEGISVSRSDIDAAYNKIIQDRGSEDDVRSVLSQLYNLNDAEFRRLIPDLLYREKIQKNLLQQVHVKHILVSSEDTAKKVKSEVTVENFNDKAKQYSEDKTTRDSGGDLGTYDIGRAQKLDPELAKAFFELSPGDISNPVKTQFGYHIILLVERTGKERKTFDEWLTEKRAQTKVRRFLK
jgi:foldase protein PrsA